MPAKPSLLLTRPSAQSARFADEARAALGPLPVVTSPLLKIRFLDAALPEAVKGVIFTSENGVHAYRRLAGVSGLMAWCVGRHTAQVARAAGFNARAASGDADALVALMIREGVAGPLLHARGANARGAVAERLNLAGIETKEAVLYDQQSCPLTSEARALLAGDAPVLVPLFSPRSAAIFAAEAGGARAPLHIVVLSPAVGRALGDLPHASFACAAHTDAMAMIEALAQRIAACGPA